MPEDDISKRKNVDFVNRPFIEDDTMQRMC